MNTKPTILIAESDHILIASIKERLRGCNIEVIGGTTDGIELVQLVKKLHPNMLILNLVLSNKDGVQVLDELKETYTNINDMVIICTSFFKGHIIDICAQKGASYFIQKPYDIDHIIDIVLLFANQFKRSNRHSEPHANEILGTTAAEQASEYVVEEGKADVLNDELMEDDDTIDSRFDYLTKSVVVREILARSGFNAGNKGFKYLTGAVLIVMAEYRRLERITVTVYPRIAEQYDTNRAAVERGIRNLITRCWDNEERRTLFDKYFPNSFTTRPSNKDVIELLARRMDTHYSEYERMCKLD